MELTDAVVNDLHPLHFLSICAFCLALVCRGLSSTENVSHVF